MTHNKCQRNGACVSKHSVNPYTLSCHTLKSDFNSATVTDICCQRGAHACSSMAEPQQRPTKIQSSQVKS